MDSKARPWPDLAIAPGELLQEELKAIGMTQKELALRTGRPAQTINEVIQATKQITHETALQLEKVLGIPAGFWMRLEANYRLNLARLHDLEELRRQEEWLKEFPIREMEKRRWIETHPKKSDKVRAVLELLGVASFQAWQQTVVGFRITPSAKVSAGALAVWLRQGELEGRKVPIGPYDEAKFRQALDSIRALTTEAPSVFLARLQELCAAAGVAVVFIPELPRSGANGAARWLRRDSALIQLSLRYKTNDHLWFSFFHEAYHILRHRMRKVHIDWAERVNDEDSLEEQADNFAANYLIPPEAWQAFLEENDITRHAIVLFAEEVGIAPGIVVGRLQHEDLLRWGSGLNHLKVRYTWKEGGS